MKTKIVDVLVSQEELISVIVPVYNIEDYLPKCLETIAAQTYRNLEIILVDDGSTDGSGRICDEFARKDPRAVVIHQENQKQGATRNAGKRVARGTYIMFVDGDDFIHPDTIAILHDAINRDGGYDIAMIDYQEAEQGADVEYEVNEEEGRCLKLSQDDLLAGFFNGSSLYNPIWNKLFRKELIEDIWSANYLRGQDSDFVLRTFLKTEKAIWFRLPLYFYVQRQGSVTHNEQSELIGRQSTVVLLYDNLRNLPVDKQCYQHYLLRELYRAMVYYIQCTYSKSVEKEVHAHCLKIESAVRKIYWEDNHFSALEKTAMTLNVRYPNFVWRMKKLTRNRLSWHMLSKF